MGTKATFNMDSVLEILADYFYNVATDTTKDKPYESVYNDILLFAKKNYPEVSMPKFSQMRKYLIKELTTNKLFKEGDILSTSVASKITELYHNADKIETKIYYDDFNIEIFTQAPIICTISLPPKEILDALAKGIRKNNKHSLTWSRVNLIHKICNKIKQKNPEIILAVIPEFSKLIYLNSNGIIDTNIDKFNPISNSLCMFVKNTEEGRKFVDSLNNKSIY